MRNTPDEDEYAEDMQRYAAEPWMMDQLTRNWDYVGWGPYEDYMCERSGPDRPMKFGTWTEFRKAFKPGHHPTDVADRSGGEIVGWYFAVERDTEQCEACDGVGYNPETKKIADDWYDFAGDWYAFAGTGRRWCDAITQDEADALVEKGRLWDLTTINSRAQLMAYVDKGKLTEEKAEALWEGRDKTRDQYNEDTGELRRVDIKWRETVPAAEVNAWNQGRGFGHDAINRGICVRTRAQRLGVYGLCPECDGHGYIPVEPEGRLQVILWAVNPATGQNYAIEVDKVEQAELEAVYDFLGGMRDRLVSRLDMPQNLTASDMREFNSDETMMWTQDASLLSGTGGWASESMFASWREFCRPVHYEYGERSDDMRVRDDHPKFKELFTGFPNWELNDLNELIGVRFGFDPHGRRLERVYFWMAHPRKGCSRRVMINNITEADLPSILTYVLEGRERARLRLDPSPDTADLDREEFFQKLIADDVPRDVGAIAEAALALIKKRAAERAAAEAKRKARAQEA